MDIQAGQRVEVPHASRHSRVMRRSKKVASRPEKLRPGLPPAWADRAPQELQLYRCEFQTSRRRNPHVSERRSRRIGIACARPLAVWGSISNSNVELHIAGSSIIMSIKLVSSPSRRRSGLQYSARKEPHPGGCIVDERPVVRMLCSSPAMGSRSRW